MGARPTTVVEIPIKVHRQVRDGWFIYTCDKLPGLYVASQDDKQAYDDLLAAIGALVEETFGTECIAALKEEVPDFHSLAARASRGRPMARLTAVVTLRRRIDKAMLEALTACMPPQAPAAADLMRSMRDGDRY